MHHSDPKGSGVIGGDGTDVGVDAEEHHVPTTSDGQRNRLHEHGDLHVELVEEVGAHHQAERGEDLPNNRHEDADDAALVPVAPGSQKRQQDHRKQALDDVLPNVGRGNLKTIQPWPCRLAI